jgi:hypothetical protein
MGLLLRAVLASAESPPADYLCLISYWFDQPILCSVFSRVFSCVLFCFSCSSLVADRPQENHPISTIFGTPPRRSAYC